MAWIESHQTLREHPKLTLMADTLGVHKAQAAGHLHFFWWWCIDYAPDGSLERFSPPQIARAAGWDGDPEAFLRCLISCGLVDRNPLRVHDWLEFCGDLVKRRLEYKSAKRRRTKRLRISLRNSDNSQRNVDISQRTVTNSTIPSVPTKPTTPTEPVVSAAPYERPDKARDPTGFLVMAYKEGLQVPFDDRPWDKQFWGRWSKEAKVILDSIGGVDDALSFLNYTAKHFTGKGLSWSLKTVADRAVLYAAKKRGKNESPHRKRVPGTDAEPRPDQEFGGLRGPPAAGAILAAVRGGKAVEDGT